MNNPNKNISFAERSFLEVLLKRKWLIVTLFITIVTTCMIGTFRMEPVYETMAKLKLKKELDPEKQTLLPGQIEPRNYTVDYIISEIEIIKSRPIAEQVVLETGLDQPGGQVAETDADDTFQQAVADLVGGLDIQKIKNTDVVTIAYRSKSPELAQRVVNTLISVYKKERNKSLYHSPENEHLDSQIRKYKNKVDRLTASTAAIKTKWEMHSISKKSEELQENLVKLRQIFIEVQAEYDAKKARLRNVEQQFTSGNDVAFPTFDTEVSQSLENHISHLKEQLLALEIEIKELLQTYTVKSKKVSTLIEKQRFLKNNYHEAIKQFIAQENVEINVLEERIRKLEADIQLQKNDIAALAQPERQLIKIDADLETTQAIYSMLVKQREANRIADTKTERMLKIHVVDPAYRPLVPVKPNKRMNLILAVILGIIIGTGTAFGVEYLDYSRQFLAQGKLRVQKAARAAAPAPEKVEHPDLKRLESNAKTTKNRKQERNQALSFYRMINTFAALISILLILIIVILSVNFRLIKLPQSHESQNNSGSVAQVLTDSTASFTGTPRVINVRKGKSLYKHLIDAYGGFNAELIREIEKMNPAVALTRLSEAGGRLVLPKSKVIYPDFLNRWVVHLSSYNQLTFAVKDFDRFRRQGYDAAVVTKYIPRKGLYYRVTVGSFQDRKQAQRLCYKIKNQNLFEYANIMDLTEIF